MNLLLCVICYKKLKLTLFDSYYICSILPCIIQSLNTYCKENSTKKNHTMTKGGLKGSTQPLGHILKSKKILFLKANFMVSFI